MVAQDAVDATFEQLTAVSKPEEIIDEARHGRMFLLVDDAARENEGDLVIAGQFATPDAINFMVTEGRGLVCLSLTERRVRQLGLEPMVAGNRTRHGTAFTVSIEAREGVSTGISAYDRARTVSAAIDPDATPDSLVSPGHVFPLAARDGGVLVRAGHTEAGVDIARLAGLIPAAVICEVMRPDGTMARLPDLIALAQRHGLKIGTIADLIAFRLRNDRTIRLVRSEEAMSAKGNRVVTSVYENGVDGAEHCAMVVGDVAGDRPVLVRMHRVSVMDDLIVPAQQSVPGMLQKAFDAVDAEGRGVVVVFRDLQPDTLRRTRVTSDQRDGGPATIRDYGVGAQILHDLGVQNLKLLSRTSVLPAGLEGFGLHICGTQGL
jgi:3,4-dihydroxy 2-butanone 4-phosphate synthase/GTP cyclohydrolase II